MKKILTSVLVVFTALFALSTSNISVNAAEGLEDIYPNNDIKNLQGQYGNSNWVLDFNGVRYHTVSSMARRISNFAGYEADGSKLEFAGADAPHISGNAMGGFIENDTAHDVVLADGDRTAFTEVINRIWLKFDAEGRLSMFEDHISTYYMTEVDGEDYFRLSTEAEIADYEAAEAEEKPANMRFTHMRMVLNDDNETYKIEPLAYLKWENADYVAANPEEGVEESGSRTVLLDHNPDHIALAAGETAMHLSTWDRGMANLMDWVKTLPEALATQTADPMELNYLDPDPQFVGLDALDVNDQMEGVNVVFEFGSTPSVATLITDVEARHVSEAQSVPGEHTKVDFKLEVFDETETLLETVDVVYDGGAYTPSVAEFTSIDTSDFGAAYTVRYSAESPVDQSVGEETITLDVGVLPININNVADRSINENSNVDLLAGITADDNYGNDITASLSYTVNKPINIYNVKAGVYDVTVKAEYFSGPTLDESQPLEVTVGTNSHTFPVENINPTKEIGIGTHTDMRLGTIITDKDVFETQIDSLLNGDLAAIWGMAFVMLDGSNKVTAYYSYVNQETMTQDGVITPIEGSQAQRPARDPWLKGLEFKENNRFIAVTNNSGTAYATFKDVDADMVVDGDLPQNFYVEGFKSYKLTAVDQTAPVVTVKSQNFTIYTDNTFENAEEAILSNVTYYDENFENAVVPGANRINITVEGEHDVRVVISDAAGNITDVEFTLVVKEARASQGDVDNTSDQTGDVSQSVSDLEDKLADAEARLDQAIKDKKEGASVVVVIAVAVVASGISFGAAALLLGKK